MALKARKAASTIVVHLVCGAVTRRLVTRKRERIETLLAEAVIRALLASDNVAVAHLLRRGFDLRLSCWQKVCLLTIRPVGKHIVFQDNTRGFVVLDVVVSSSPILHARFEFAGRLIVFAFISGVLQETELLDVRRNLI